MSQRRPVYLITSSLAVAGMLATPFQAMAQNAGPDQDDYNQGQSQDPPARVGRLAVIEGTVSAHASGQTQWSPAVLNAPVSDGDAVWTEPQATAEIEATSSNLWMNGGTEFDIITLSDSALHASEPQGEVYIHLRNLAPDETYTIETPRGAVTLGTDGEYDIFAGDTQAPTAVTVLDGSAQITGANIALQVHAGQTASITGDSTYQGNVGPLVQDDFLNAMQRRERTDGQVHGVPPPQAVAQMTGGEDLATIGEWANNDDYGQIWYPPVGSEWVPYREGRWSYVAPWGWTWVDAAPWGFAPFHYGRWVQVGPRWGWAPVYPGYTPAFRPVYAPALVSFFGVGIAIGVGVGFGLDRGPAFGLGAHIGWVPLGPREPYFPPYRTSRVYINRVNVTNIRNVTNIYSQAEARRSMPIDRFQNNHGATLVPAQSMTDSRRIAGDYRQPTPAELSAARPVVDRAPVAPGGHTLGLTPRVAERLNVRNAQMPHAPGPQIAPASGFGTASRLELRSVEGGPAGRGGQPAPLSRTGEPRGTAPHGEQRAPGPLIGSQPVGHPTLREPGASPLAHPGAATDRAERQSAPAHASERHGVVTPRTAEPEPAIRHDASHPAPAVQHDASRPAPAEPEHREPSRTEASHPSAPRPTPHPEPQPRPPAPHTQPSPPPHHDDKDHPPH